MATLWHLASDIWQLTDLPNITTPISISPHCHWNEWPHSNCLVEETRNLTCSFKHETSDLSSVKYRITKISLPPRDRTLWLKSRGKLLHRNSRGTSNTADGRQRWKKGENEGDLSRKFFCLEPGHKTVGGPITRGLDRWGSCLVPGGTRLSLDFAL